MKPQTYAQLTNQTQWFDEVTGYVNNVLTGVRVASLTERLACQRFKNDYEESLSNPDYKFRFDFQKAWKVIAFIEQLPHVKGHFAAKIGADRLIKLEPWQKFIVANMFGWVKKSNGLRRFTVVYLRIPRKNGKSVLAAGIGLYMLCADGEPGAEVYCGACTLKQADEVFSPASKMVERTPKLKAAYGLEVLAKSIKRRDGSKFEPVIGKPGDGASPSLAIVDEYHQHDTAALFDTMVTGMGARLQPLVLVITTSGENLFSPCYEMDKDAVKVLHDPSTWPEMFTIIYGIDDGDDWTGPAVLEKANPNYGISVGPDFIKAAQALAKTKTNKQNAFKTKHLNVWCFAKKAYFNALNWQLCADESMKLDDFYGEQCWIGLDFAKKRDLNALIIVFTRQEYGAVHYYVFSRFYLPEDSVTEAENDTLQKLYSTWVNSGHLTKCPGNEMDFNMIRDDVLEYSHLFSVEEVPHDPHGAIQISHDLADAGLTPVSMTQHGNTYTLPINELEAAIDAKRIHHDNNPVLAWCIANVIVHEYRGGNKMPDKQDDQSKIDGASALLMAMARAMPIGEPELHTEIIF